MNAKSKRPNVWGRAIWLLGIIAPLLLGYNLFSQWQKPRAALSLERGKGLFTYRVISEQRDGVEPGGESLYWYYYDLTQPVPYTIDLGASQTQITLLTPKITLEQASHLAVNSTNFVVLVFWLSSVLVLRQRYRQPEVRVLFSLSQAIAVAMIFPLAHPSPSMPPFGLLVLKFTSYFAIAPLLLHYLLLFPRPMGRILSSYRWGLFFLYAGIPLALIGWMFVGRLGWQIGAGYHFIIAVVAISVMLYSYRYRTELDSRRRLRVVVFGTLLAGIPPILLYILPAVFGFTPILPEWATSLFLVIAVFSYLYATARHHLFDIDHLLNRTLVYTILSLGIFGLYLGPFLLLYWRLPGNIFLQMVVISGLTLLVGWSFDWARTRVQRFVDRLFYGGWYDYPGVVETVSDALARSLAREEVRAVLTQQVPEMMQLRSGHLWIGESNATFPSVPPPHERFRFKFQSDVPAQWSVGPHQDGSDLSEVDLRILNTLARQAEIALNNVLLVETLRRQLDALQASRETLTQTQRQLLRSREEERARLSRELHDSPVQTLVGLNIQLGLLLAEGDRDSPLRQPLSEMRAEVRELLSELRQVCAELRPPMLDSLGLGAALRSHTEEWGQHHRVETSLDLPADEILRQLPDEVALNLYRVTQEALGNVARHARAQRVDISLTWEGDQLCMIIRDDGRGFEVPETLHNLPTQDHYGLVGMRERIELIGGTWSLESAPGQGTTVRVIWNSTRP